jgi:rSAM/selenodomain-associated transferase 1
VKPVAVVVMARVPGFGPAKTRLCPPLTRDQAALGYRCFLLDRLDQLAAIEGVAPAIAYTPEHGARQLARLAPPSFSLYAQRGPDLGARLDAILTELIEAGHAGAIAIDSDSPTLPMDWIALGARALASRKADLVVGPCDDGGYYAVGLRVPRAALFADMPWSTSEILSRTLERAGTLGLAVEQLPLWFDVDTEADLRRLYGERDRHPLPRRTGRWLEVIYSCAGSP